METIDQQGLIARLLELFVDVSETGACRSITVHGAPGVGKTFVIQQFYEALAADHQSSPAYWPPSVRTDDHPFAVRSLVYPSPYKTTWPADALPDWFWWGVNCERAQRGDISENFDTRWLDLHRLALFEQWKRVTPDHEKRQKRLEQLADRLATDVPEESVLDLLSELIPLPFVGLAVKNLNALAAVVVRQSRIRRLLGEDVDLADLIDDGTEAERIASAAREVSSLASSGIPVVLIADQFQEAGASTRDFIAQLEGAPGAILVVRLTDSGVLSTEDGREHVELEALSRPERIRMLHELAPSLSADECDQAATAYSTPLGVMTFAVDLAAENYVVNRLLLHEHPVDLRASYKRAYDRLSSEGQSALRIAARVTTSGIGGDAFDAFIDAVVWRRATGVKQHVVDELVRAGWIRQLDPALFEFNDLAQISAVLDYTRTTAAERAAIGDALRSELPKPGHELTERARRHRHVLMSLLAVPPDQGSSELLVAPGDHALADTSSDVTNVESPGDDLEMAGGIWAHGDIATEGEPLRTATEIERLTTLLAAESGVGAFEAQIVATAILRRLSDGWEHLVKTCPWHVAELLHQVSWYACQAGAPASVLPAKMLRRLDRAERWPHALLTYRSAGLFYSKQDQYPTAFAYLHRGLAWLESVNPNDRSVDYQIAYLEAAEQLSVALTGTCVRAAERALMQPPQRPGVLGAPAADLTVVLNYLESGISSAERTVAKLFQLNVIARNTAPDELGGQPVLLNPSWAPRPQIMLARCILWSIPIFNLADPRGLEQRRRDFEQAYRAAVGAFADLAAQTDQHLRELVQLRLMFSMVFPDEPLLPTLPTDPEVSSEVPDRDVLGRWLADRGHDANGLVDIQNRDFIDAWERLVRSDIRSWAHDNRDLSRGARRNG